MANEADLQKKINLLIKDNAVLKEVIKTQMYEIDRLESQMPDDIKKDHVAFIKRSDILNKVNSLKNSMITANYMLKNLEKQINDIINQVEKDLKS